VLRNRWKVILATVLIFVLSMVAFSKFVQKQFFPSASRLELMVDVWLPQGASLKATAHEVKRIEACSRVTRQWKVTLLYSNGAPRFFLSLDQQLFADNFGQFVIVSKDLQAREDIKRRLDEKFAGPEFADIRVRVCVWRTVRPSAIRCNSVCWAMISSSCARLQRRCRA